MKKRKWLLMESQIAAGSDCRPGITAQRDILQSDGKLLNPTDRILFQLASSNRYTRAQIASLLGISESCLSYRIGRLTRMLSRQFPLLLSHSHRCKIDHWKILRMAHLHRRSLRAMALQTGLSLHQIRKSIDGLKRIRNTKTK